MTCGEGKARAVASKRITSFQEMRNRSKWQITDREEVDKVREKAKEVMSDWRTAVLAFYGEKNFRGDIDTWNGLDASMRAIAKWAKGKELAGALHSEGFKNVPTDVIEQGVKAGNLFMSAPVPYFEAKPERAVKLEEFAGAVIPEDASESVKAILKKHGVPIQTYPKRFDETARTAVVDKFRQELLVQGENVLFQRGPTNRGLIRLYTDRINISMLKDANLSTFLHENSHLWLEELIDDATAEDVKPEFQKKLQDDLDLALDYLGLSVRAKDGADAIRAAITVEHHETWARSGEAYLMEGKSPSAALRPLLARFRAWLVSIYKALSNLNVELTPEVRGVFDRLLATDAEIEAAQAEAHVVPLFGTAAEFGKSDIEFESYRKIVEQASVAAQEDIEQKLIAEYQRESRKQWKEERDKVKAEVAAEVDAQRVYKAIAALKEKDGVKLDRKAIIDSHGNEFVKRLPRGIAVKEGGAHVDTVAELVGYNSGQEMLNDLAGARPRNALIEAEADRLMRERHGDMLTDGSLHDKARQAVMNEYRGKVIEAEIRALNRKAREVKPYLRAAEKAETEQGQAGRAIYQALVPNLAVVRRQAEQMIAAKTVREIKPMQYFAAARRSSRAAIEAVRKKDYLLAGHQKGMELLNLELYRQAIKAQEEIEAVREYDATFDKPGKRERIGKAGGDFLEQIDVLRDRFTFRPVSEKVRAKRRQTLKEWDDTLVGRAEESLRKLPPEKHRILKNMLDRMGDKLTSWDTSLVQVRAIVNLLDDGPVGPWNDYFLNRASEAQTDEQKINADILVKIDEAIEKYVEHNSGRMTDMFQTRLVPTGAMSRYELMSMVFNMGNESSFDKLIRGRQWEGRETEVMSLLHNLDSRDARFIQDTWNTVGSLWSAIAELEKRVSGVEPERVTSRSFTFTTADGVAMEMEGGYFPLKYDPRFAEAGRKQEQGQLNEGGYIPATTPRGHTKKRTGYAGPILFDFGHVLQRHLRGVIKDVTHREFINDARSLLKDSRIKDVIRERIGWAYVGTMQKWLHGIVNDGSAVSTHGLDSP